MKKLFCLFFLLPTFLYSQQTVGLFNNQQNSLNGYTIVTPMRSTKTYLIDNCGNKVYEWQSNHPALDAELLSNGELIRSIFLPNSSFNFGGTTGGIEILDSNGDQVLEISICTDSLMLHHDFEVLPNGNILVLAVELIDSVNVVNSGSIVYEKRFAETILEIDRESLNIVWKWRSWDHLIQDVSPDYPNYGVISDYPGRININYYYDESDPDWLHFNSIDYNEDLDQIMVGSPHFNELWIIDHSTTTQEATTSTGGDFNKGGDLLYRWGNPAAYQRGSESDQKFEFQHSCSWIPNGLPNEGKIMIFNNGSDRLFSSVDIINPVLNSNNYLFSDQQTFLPDETFFSYSDSAKFFSNIVSGAQQLENGNILICSGSQGRIFEIENQTNAVVWDYRLPFNFIGGIPLVMSQGDSISRSLIFRSKKYSPSFVAFNYLDLETSSPLELNPFPNNCQLFIKGCMDTSMSNFSSDANIDDGSCVSWEALVIDLQAQLNEVVPEDGIGQSEVDAAYAAGVASVEVQECEEVATQNIPLDLPQGWSMFGYTCLESIDVVEAFSGVSDNIEIVKDEWGLAYLPAWGFSAFSNLEFGEGYQIKMIEAVTDFQFCEAIVPEDGISQADVDDAAAAVEASYTGWIAPIYGCTGPDHCNYNALANTDDGSCVYAQEGYDCDGNVILHIGDLHAGGIVFQINEDGTGLVADLQDLGYMNWNDAMGAAENSTSQGYEDWYLPSIEELELMYNTIGLGGDNSGDFESYNQYWSSTEGALSFIDNGEIYETGVHALFVHFENGWMFYLSKTVGMEVRAIRAF